MYGETEAQQTPAATTKCSSLRIHGLNAVTLHEKFLCLDIFLFLLKLSVNKQTQMCKFNNEVIA